MSVSLQSGSRPPYAEFYEKSVEDRDATIASGRLVMKSQNWVNVKQAGSKDSIDVVADDWVGRLSQDANMDPLWIDRYKLQYKSFKEGFEATPNGTHIRMWPAITKAQADNILTAGIKTVEDLANANAEGLARIGMGAMDLHQKAKAFLASASGDGKAAEQIIAQGVRLAEQDKELSEMKRQIKVLMEMNTRKAASEVDDFLGQTSAA